MRHVRPGRWLAATLAGLALACTPLPIPENAPYHQSDADVSVTRLVHGSLLLEVAGTRLYVDPWLYSGIFFRHTEPLGLRPHALPPADAVLITHRHRDHFDPRALARLAESVTVAITPPALVDEVRALGFESVVGLETWNQQRVGTVTVTAVPAHHAVPENGYVVSADAVRVYAAGDTRTSSAFADIRSAFPDTDVVLLPIGGQRLLGVPREMTPEQAAKAAALLGAHRTVPIGYGRTGGHPFFWYARNPVARFLAAARSEGISDDAIVVLSPGESWHYYR